MKTHGDDRALKRQAFKMFSDGESNAFVCRNLGISVRAATGLRSDFNLLHGATRKHRIPTQATIPMFEANMTLREIADKTGLSLQSVKERHDEWQSKKYMVGRSKPVRKPVVKPRRFCCSGTIFTRQTSTKSIWMD